MSEAKHGISADTFVADTAPKRPWHAPNFDEIDVLDTESGLNAPVADAGSYGS